MWIQALRFRVDVLYPQRGQLNLLLSRLYWLIQLKKSNKVSRSNNTFIIIRIRSSKAMAALHLCYAMKSIVDPFFLTDSTYSNVLFIFLAVRIFHPPFVASIVWHGYGCLEIRIVRLYIALRISQFFSAWRCIHEMKTVVKKKEKGCRFILEMQDRLFIPYHRPQSRCHWLIDKTWRLQVIQFLREEQIRGILSDSWDDVRVLQTWSVLQEAAKPFRYTMLTDEHL